MGVLRDPESGQLRVMPVYDEKLLLMNFEMLARNALRMTACMEDLLTGISDEEANMWREMSVYRIKMISDWLDDLQEEVFIEIDQ